MTMAESDRSPEPRPAPPTGGQPYAYPAQPAAFPPQGFPRQGFPPHGFPPQGFPPQGFPPQGFPPQQGIPPQGFPPQGFPPPHPTSGPRARPGRGPIVVLTAVAAVLAIVAGVFTALYVSERADLAAATTTRADRERDLAAVTGQADAMDDALEGNRSREATLSAEHDKLTACVDATRAYFDLQGPRSAESTRLFRVMYEACVDI